MPRTQYLRQLLQATSVVCLLSACAITVPTPENSAWTGLWDAMSADHNDPTASVQLSPLNWYLKVKAPGTAPALLAFGFWETDTKPPTEVWFSAGGQYIKLQSGRIVATHGLAVDWKRVTADPTWPHWSAMADGHNATFTRTRSILPTYDFGVTEQIQLSAVPGPTEAVASVMPGATNEKTRHWHWYREVVRSSPRPKIPDSIFATAYLQGTSIVAYSMQCLSETLCLQIMRWPQLEGEAHPW